MREFQEVMKVKKFDLEKKTFSAVHREKESAKQSFRLRTKEQIDISAKDVD